MRIFLLFIFLITIQTAYCQKSGKTTYQKAITYRHGCHGNCNMSYEPDCGLKKDSIIEVIYVTKTAGIYFVNDRQLSQQQAQSLDTLLLNQFGNLKLLVSELDKQSKLQFIPPDPVCYEFEEYQISYKGSTIKYKVLSQEADAYGNFLREKDIRIFKELNKLLK
jgi:hypothetical protein